MLYASIFWGIVFGAIGMGYFAYSRAQHNPFALFSGIALCVFPYFVEQIGLMLLVGAALMAVPFLIKV